MIITVIHIHQGRVYCHPTRPWWIWGNEPRSLRYFGEGTTMKFDAYMDLMRAQGNITGFSAVEIEDGQTLGD